MPQRSLFGPYQGSFPKPPLFWLDLGIPPPPVLSHALGANVLLVKTRKTNRTHEKHGISRSVPRRDNLLRCNEQ